MDQVWSEVPVRQWMLTLPPRVRYALAWRHDLCTAVAGVLFRAVQRHLRTWAQTRRIGGARSGAIIVVQRFGGAVNLNVHLHALVLNARTMQRATTVLGDARTMVRRISQRLRTASAATVSRLVGARHQLQQKQPLVNRILDRTRARLLGGDIHVLETVGITVVSVS